MCNDCCIKKCSQPGQKKIITLRVTPHSATFAHKVSKFKEQGIKKCWINEALQHISHFPWFEKL
jgi:hypothetical protein